MPRDRRARLTDSAEFEKVYRQGTAYRGGLVSVHAFTNEVGVARLGLSVSRKVGTAVVRNAVRRRLREIFHAELRNLEFDLDLVVSARPAAAQASFHELEAEFSKALKKVGRVAEQNRG